MKPGRVRLVVVRHGQAEANVEQRYLGLRDDPLTAVGVAQAEALGRALAVMPLAAVYSSPLTRALDTAAPIARAHGLTVIPEARLKEMSFGAWEGLTRAELIASGEQAAAHLARWELDPAAVAPPGGEALATVERRVLDLLADLVARQPEGAAVLVSHVGPIKALLCAALGLPLSAAGRMFLDPATISVVDWGPRPVVRLFNDHAHLGWDNARWMR